MKILILHGPNLPLLGKVSASQGTRLTLDKVNSALRRRANDLQCELQILQFYDEYRMVKTISTHRNACSGILISPGSLARQCYSIREVLAILALPTVEIQLAEFPFAEENFRNSVLTPVVQDRILLPGKEAYLQGLESLLRWVAKSR